MLYYWLFGSADGQGRNGAIFRVTTLEILVYFQMGNCAHEVLLLLPPSSSILLLYLTVSGVSSVMLQQVTIEVGVREYFDSERYVPPSQVVSSHH